MYPSLRCRKARYWSRWLATWSPMSGLQAVYRVLTYGLGAQSWCSYVSWPMTVQSEHETTTSENHIHSINRITLYKHTWAALFCAARFDVDNSRFPPFLPSAPISSPLSAFVFMRPVPAIAGSMLWSWGLAELEGCMFSMLWEVCGECTWARRCSRRAGTNIRLARLHQSYLLLERTRRITNFALQHCPITEKSAYKRKSPGWWRAYWNRVLHGMRCWGKGRLHVDLS